MSLRKPRIFIASSTEALTVAEAININLDWSAETVLWTRSSPSRNFIDVLAEHSKSVDFAAFICSPDDSAVMRGEEKKIIRDNVLFELGLFMGRLGKERCFVVQPRGSGQHIPTDLLGFTPLDYEENRIDGDLRSATQAVASQIRIVMERMGAIVLPSESIVPVKGEFRLVDSFPHEGDNILQDEIRKIYLKFSTPVDRASALYIGNYYVEQNTFAQWNTAGWIEFSDDDTKLSWHIHENWLNQESMHSPWGYDYPRFEIHVGREPDEWRLMDVHGNKLPLIKIPVKLRKI